MLTTIALCYALGGCSTPGLHVARPTWRDQVAYHALLVASQYQEQLRVVVAKLICSSATQDIETNFAMSLKESVSTLTGVREVHTQSQVGALRLEVHFATAPGNEQNEQVRRIVEDFLKEKADNSKPPLVTLDTPTIR